MTISTLMQVPSPIKILYVDLIFSFSAEKSSMSEPFGRTKFRPIMNQSTPWNPEFQTESKDFPFMSENDFEISKMAHDIYPILLDQRLGLDAAPNLEFLLSDAYPVVLHQEP